MRDLGCDSSFRAQGHSKFETAPALSGATLTIAPLLNGSFHRVAEPLKVEGNLGAFVIESRFGKFSVLGARMLAGRVSELHAIESLHESAHEICVWRNLKKAIQVMIRTDCRLVNR